MSDAVYQFDEFTVDSDRFELRRKNLTIKLERKPLELLILLIRYRNRVVAREEIADRLWGSEVFVDLEHGINTAIRKIRAALDDDPGEPRFIKTVTGMGYRFVGEVRSDLTAPEQPAENGLAAQNAVAEERHPRIRSRYWVPVSALLLLAIGGLLYWRSTSSRRPSLRRLTRLTFDTGLQSTPTLSPDGRYVAYSTSRGGTSDIWVQQVGGSGSPIRVTDGKSTNWEPEWSPNGQYIAYRSESDGGGLFIVPAVGGTGRQRRISSFGHFPHWSPDSSKIIFQTHHFGISSKIFLLDVREGSEPREIFSSVTSSAYILSAAWHPDGKRVSLWGWDVLPSPIPTFWTAKIDSPEAAVKVTLSDELVKVAEVEAGASFGGWADSDSRFYWDHSGRNIYFERMFRGARNIWRMQVNPETLRAEGLERITTGTELASDFALSADDRKMVFTSKEENIRAWIFPLKGSEAGLMSDGQAVTPSGMEAWENDISADASKIAFSCKRAGQWDLCEQSLSSGTTDVITSDDSFIRDEPHWSRDGKHLAYIRLNRTSAEVQMVTWDATTREEKVVATLQHRLMFVYDWYPGGEWLSVAVENAVNGQTEIWKYRASGVSSPEDAQKILEPGANESLFQAHLSADGKWIVFEGVAPSPRGDRSAIYVAPANGGRRIRIADDAAWQDKPRWSADGKRIYFVGERSGYLNLFSVPFDPVQGRVSGEVRQISNFKNPEFEIGSVIPTIGFSVAGDKIAITMAQASGGLWVLDNVAQ
ncbi:MAG: PD40 domain-containing protein [Acidobacteria bacterium]|nr:PD40 domain-containing protein [Acidobacteriota bacterium]